MSAKDAGLFPALKLDAHGRCPNCLIKPLPYKGGGWQSTDRQHFCHRCSRSYNFDTGEQRPNHAWLAADDGQFRPRYADGPASDYVHVKPSEATLRAAARIEAKRR